LDEFGIYAGVGFAEDIGIAEIAKRSSEFGGGEGNGLEHHLGEIDEVGGGFGIEVAAGDGVVEADEGGAEAAGADIVGAEARGEVIASLCAVEAFVFLLGVEVAVVRFVAGARSFAAASVGESEFTTSIALDRERCRHGNLLKG
jgi:hypothetical protein